LQRSKINALSVDVATLTAADLDGIGEFVDSGRTVLFGVVPATAPGGPPPSAEQIAATVAGVTDRLGFSRSVLRDRVGVTPACGLAGATLEWARSAVELAQRASDRLAEDPEEI
jgi:methionine synthase II (cobalamin-independent)